MNALFDGGVVAVVCLFFILTMHRGGSRGR